MQDSAATTLANAPGQTIGALLRASGSVDLLQSSAAARPILVSWPKGGRANLLSYSEDLTNSVWNKVQATILRSNIDTAPDGTMTADRIEGSSTSGGQHVNQVVSLAEASIYTISVHARPVVDGFPCLRIALTGRDGTTRFGAINISTGAAVASSAAMVLSSESLADGWKRLAIRVTSGSGASNASLRLYGAESGGEPFVLATGKQITVWGVQIELASAPSPYQRVVTSYDIVQSGVPSLWHLFDEDADSLPVVLPAGAYGFGHVNHLGAVSLQTITSDGTTPIDALAAERIADVVMRFGAFTPAEASLLASYWQSRYLA